MRPLPWIGLVFLLSASPACAHDFWLQPVRFWIDRPGAVPLTLQVGHGADRRRSPLPRARVTRFEAIGQDGKVQDLAPALTLGEAAADGYVSFAHTGTHVLAFETDNRARSQLPAARFNAHLAAEGLTSAIEHRRRTRKTEAEGSEIYSRRAKAIVQVGPSSAASASASAVTRPVGLTLEIVPEVNPYASPRPAVLPVRVLYEGEPLPGALVKLTDLDEDGAASETRLTDASGRAVFDMPMAGAWRFNVVWSKPLPLSAEADFETVFSSLSFGLPSPP